MTRKRKKILVANLVPTLLKKPRMTENIAKPRLCRMLKHHPFRITIKEKK